MANGLQNTGFVMIDGFPIDISLSEDHTFDSDITDFPVETGADVTDNIRPKPIVVSFEGVVSDTPLQPIASHVTRQLDDLPQVNAYLHLQAIRNARLPVQITTSLDVFNSMALKTLTIPRNAANSNSLHFKVTFVQITQVNVARVSVPIATPPHQVTGNGAVLVTTLIPIDLDDMSWFDVTNSMWWYRVSPNFGKGHLGDDESAVITPAANTLYILSHDAVASTQYPRPDIAPPTQLNTSGFGALASAGIPFSPADQETLVNLPTHRNPANITYVPSGLCQIF